MDPSLSFSHCSAKLPTSAEEPLPQAVQEKLVWLENTRQNESKAFSGITECFSLTTCDNFGDKIGLPAFLGMRLFSATFTRAA